MFEAVVYLLLSVIFLSAPHLDLTGSQEKAMLVRAPEVLFAIDRAIVLAPGIVQLHTHPPPRGKFSDTHKPTITHEYET